MARPRTFDEAEVLERAMRVFWARGFAGTSVQDLVDALGINRASLYATFGDKEGLFARALCRYREQSGEQLRSRLTEAPSGKTFLRRLFTATVDEFAHSDERRGCFVANAAAERGAGHPATREFLNANEREMLAVFRAALDRAAAEGDLDPSRDRDALARTLFALHNGLNVLGRYHDEPGSLRGVVGEAMRLVG